MTEARIRQEFQPTLPARGATHHRYAYSPLRAISTHAPRTGSDIRRLRIYQSPSKFQPTLPARGATGTTLARHTARIFQPTLPARGATTPEEMANTPWEISTHAPRTGSDEIVYSTRVGRKEFQPTLPARGATDRQTCTTGSASISTHAPRTGSDPRGCRKPVRMVDISTHAPRTGSDGGNRRTGQLYRDFNPRSPHGERLPRVQSANTSRQFQPTLPARGATGK